MIYQKRRSRKDRAEWKARARAQLGGGIFQNFWMMGLAVCLLIELMDGHKWEKFVLDLSFLGWGIVGALCFGVGTLWVTPWPQRRRSSMNMSVPAPQRHKRAFKDGHCMACSVRLFAKKLPDHADPGAEEK